MICSYNAAYFLYCSPCDTKVKKFNIGRAEYIQIDIHTAMHLHLKYLVAIILCNL